MPRGGRHDHRITAREVADLLGRRGEATVTVLAAELGDLGGDP
jgi:hypothetical protein